MEFVVYFCTFLTEVTLDWKWVQWVNGSVNSDDGSVTPVYFLHYNHLLKETK